MRIYLSIVLSLVFAVSTAQQPKNLPELAELLVAKLPDTLLLNLHEWTAFRFSPDGVPLFDYAHKLNKHVLTSLQANGHLFDHAKCYGLYVFADPVTAGRIINLRERSCGKIFDTSCVDVAVERGFYAFSDSLLKDWAPIMQNTALLSLGAPKTIDILINKVGEATFYGEDVLIQRLHAARKPFWRSAIYYGTRMNNMLTLHVFPAVSAENRRIEYGEIAFVLSERFEGKVVKFDWNWRGETDSAKHTAVSFIYNPAQQRISDAAIHADERGDAKRFISWFHTHYDQVKDDFLSRYNWSSRYFFYID